MNFKIQLKIIKTALKILVKEIGLFKLMIVGCWIDWGYLTGQPYRKLPKPESKKDKDSRALIKQAILLYRGLLHLYPQEKAEEIIRKVIIECAITQLRCLIPTLKEEDLAKLSPEERTKCYCDIVEGFPNTDWKVTTDTETEVGIDITRCRLAEIFDMCGHPELRDSCCTGDAIYFSKYQPEINFSREHMIGKGASCCDFNFKLKNPSCNGNCDYYKATDDNSSISTDKKD